MTAAKEAAGAEGRPGRQRGGSSSCSPQVSPPRDPTEAALTKAQQALAALPPDLQPDRLRALRLALEHELVRDEPIPFATIRLSLAVAPPEKFDQIAAGLRKLVER